MKVAMKAVDRYAVVGNPVEHSLSPRIHALFTNQCGQSLVYERLLAPLDGFAATAAGFFDDGGLGLNVTVPFKGDAADWVQQTSEDAAFAHAVNTIVREADGTFSGHNTDGSGLVVDLTRLLPDLTDARVLLLGAGGAARGVVRPLLAGTLVREMVIANRTSAKAEALARRVIEAGFERVRGTGLDTIGGEFDLVINATSAGLSDQVPSVDPGHVAGAVCYDMVYGGQTAFCRWALARGAVAVHDGLGMLVAQAAQAFELWRGVKPETGPVLALLAEELAEEFGES